ncbi:MAG TPA: hypothetical protein VD794_13190 [Flavisolibacter sp.]|nr:hypothetical protein [Flavisolibacter sp.]
MKTALRSTLLLIFFALSIIACSKSGSGGGGEIPPPEDENLVVKITPDPGSSTTPVKANGPTYNFNIVIESKIPADGVEVKVKFTKDLDGTVIPPNDYTSSSRTTPIPITISNLTVGEVGTVTVLVTSKTKPSNKVTKTFRLVRK